MLPIEKLKSLSERHRELEELLCVADIISDTRRYTMLRREHAELGGIVDAFARHQKATHRLADDRADGRGERETLDGRADARPDEVLVEC